MPGNEHCTTSISSREFPHCGKLGVLSHTFILTVKGVWEEKQQNPPKTQHKQNKPARALYNCEKEIQSSCDTGWYISLGIKGNALTRSGVPRKCTLFELTVSLCFTGSVACRRQLIQTQLTCSVFTNLMLHCIV